MVEDISFPKNLPKISGAKRVKRTARQNEEKQKQPFQKYLSQNEDQLKNGADGQDSDKKKKKSKPTGANFENTAEPTADKLDGSESDTQGKRIDVHA